MCLLKLLGFGTFSWDLHKILFANNSKRYKDQSQVESKSHNKRRHSPSNLKIPTETHRNPCAGSGGSGLAKFLAITSDEHQHQFENLESSCRSKINNNQATKMNKCGSHPARASGSGCRPGTGTGTGFMWNIEDTSALVELRERVEHKNRVMDGLSEPHMADSAPLERFSQVYAEFLNFYSRSQLRLLEKDFLQTDLDQDGFLNKIEIKYWMEKRLEPINERQLREILSHCDEDMDGALSFREFLLMCQHVKYINVNKSDLTDSICPDQEAGLKHKRKSKSKSSDKNKCYENHVPSPKPNLTPHLSSCGPNPNLTNIPIPADELMLECTQSLKCKNDEDFHCQSEAAVKEELVKSKSKCRSKSKSKDKSNSKCKGTVKDTVKFFQTQINELTKDADLSRVQNEELRNNKLKNKVTCQPLESEEDNYCENTILKKDCGSKNKNIRSSSSSRSRPKSKCMQKLVTNVCNNCESQDSESVSLSSTQEQCQGQGQGQSHDSDGIEDPQSMSTCKENENVILPEENLAAVEDECLNWTNSEYYIMTKPPDLTENCGCAICDCTLPEPVPPVPSGRFSLEADDFEMCNSADEIVSENQNQEFEFVANANPEEKTSLGFCPSEGNLTFQDIDIDIDLLNQSKDKDQDNNQWEGRIQEQDLALHRLQPFAQGIVASVISEACDSGNFCTPVPESEVAQDALLCSEPNLNPNLNLQNCCFKLQNEKDKAQNQDFCNRDIKEKSAIQNQHQNQDVECSSKSFKKQSWLGHLLWH